MDRETDNDGVLSADASSEEVHGKGKEGVHAEMIASDHDEENSKSPRGARVEEEATCEPEENRGNVDFINTSEDLDVKKNEVNDPPISNDGRIVFEINSIDGDGPPRLHLENTSPPQEEDEAEEDKSTAAPADEGEVGLLQELCVHRNEALRQRRLLQMKLAVLFRKKAGDDAHLDRAVPVSEQLQQYEKYINMLTDLKQQLGADSESAQQQAEGQRSKAREKLDTVEDEWRALVAQKQEVAVAALSRRLGQQAAQAEVEATMETETLLQQELIKQRLKHIKLRIKIHRLEAELHEEDQHSRDPRHLQFEQLQAERLELKKYTDKKNEVSSKMQKSISSSLELLSNVKEKLFWSQMEVQAQREQLSMVEAMVARKRDLLTRTRQARNGLLRDNLRLKEHRGLLGNRILLRDFEDTVDASDHLKEQLEDLKCRRVGMVFSCGRWKKKTTS
ncbi:coiled-coil domain-containing protein 96 [Cyclopterus lumpus]|uniref:Cilia and flagella associated protein 184 n=1 Tax=Cyclopterus lumpus TaxID=8103 RepID=A0A8C2ZB92_CYCLU|nr:coiled-coil domain-containing protein 96 [Cyclopterus lumpus]